MRITMQYLDSIRPAHRANSSAVVIDCKMTHGEMFDALLQFLEHTTGEEWEKWKRQIDTDCKEIERG